MGTLSENGVGLFGCVVVYCRGSLIGYLFELVACCIVGVGDGALSCYRYSPRKVQVIVFYCGNVFVLIAGKIAILIVAMPGSLGLYTRPE